jgi:hypothetical protein
MWEPAKFSIFTDEGPEEVEGYAYRGVGLDRRKEWRDTAGVAWCMTHLKTGFAIAALRDDADDIFEIAARIAESDDWQAIGDLEDWYALCEPYIERLNRIKEEIGLDRFYL